MLFNLFKMKKEGYKYRQVETMFTFLTIPNLIKNLFHYII